MIKIGEDYIKYTSFISTEEYPIQLIYRGDCDFILKQSSNSTTIESRSLLNSIMNQLAEI